MEISLLASGSSGNSLFIKTKSCNILVDVGTNMTYLTKRLSEMDTSLADINYIFISHTHTDHTSALDKIIKKYKPTICLSELMYNDLSFLNGYDNILFYEQTMIIDKMKIEIIKTSHDTSDSRGFVFTEDDKSIVYVTDTGYLNSKYFKILENKNIYVFESNHDIEMLINGKYPRWLQNRVLSDVGHLSNSASSYYLSKLIGPSTKKIILSHLSKENNSEDIALDTIKKLFKDSDIDFDNIIVAKQDEATEVITL